MFTEIISGITEGVKFLHISFFLENGPFEKIDKITEISPKITDGWQPCNISIHTHRFTLQLSKIIQIIYNQGTVSQVTFSI